MLLPPKDSTAKVLKEVLLLIEKIGSDKTLQFLRKEGRNQYHSRDNTVAEDIVDTVCYHFRTSRSKLQTGTSKDDRTAALSICFFLFDKLANFNQQETADYFRKSRSLVSVYIAKITDLDPSHKEQHEIVDKLKNITEEVTGKIEERSKKLTKKDGENEHS